MIILAEHFHNKTNNDMKKKPQETIDTMYVTQDTSN